MITPMINDYYLEDTILIASDTRFSVEAYLYDVDHLIEPNKDGVYSCSFYPKYCEDYVRIQQIAEKATDRIKASTPPYSNKVVSFDYEGQRGDFITSQLDAPKLNIKLEPWDTPLIFGKECSLNLRFQDLKLGKVYLICDYVDFYGDPLDKDEVAPTEVIDDGF